MDARKFKVGDKVWNNKNLAEHTIVKFTKDGLIAYIQRQDIPLLVFKVNKVKTNQLKRCPINTTEPIA